MHVFTDELGEYMLHVTMDELETGYGPLCFRIVVPDWRDFLKLNQESIQTNDARLSLLRDIAVMSFGSLERLREK